MKFQGFKELETGKQSTAWHTQLPNFIEYMNSRIIEPKKIDMMADVAGNVNKKGDIIGFQTSQKVRRILDFPIKPFNSKKEATLKFRAGDIRWSKQIFKIMRVIKEPNQVVLYFLNKEDEPDEIDGRVAYTKNQLLKVD
jgi:hypothetical protein